MSAAESLPFFGPELALSGALLLVILVDLAMRGRDGAGEWAATITMAAAAATIVLTVGLPLLGWRGIEAAQPTWLFERMLALDAFAVFFKALLGLSLLAVVVMSLGSNEIARGQNQGR